VPRSRPTITLLLATVILGAGACAGGTTASSTATTAPDATAAPAGTAAPGGSDAATTTTAKAAGSRATTTTARSSATPTTAKATAPGVPSTREDSRQFRLADDGFAGIAFGTAEDDVVAQLAPELGSAERGPVSPDICAGHRFARWGAAGIQLLFSGGRFDGWYVDRAGFAAAEEGVRVGSPGQKVVDAFNMQLTWSDALGIGKTFTVRSPVGVDETTMSGVMEGPGDGHVKAMWAGNACIAH
jgi:hypothetical protein